MGVDDAEVVVLLASVMHDLGMSVIRDGHEVFSVEIARGILKMCLPLVYETEEAAIMSSEILHAIISHQASVKPLTLEAGVARAPLTSTPSR